MSVRILSNRSLRVFIILAIAFVSPIKLSAQKPNYTYAELDSITYNYYLERNWEKVLFYGNIALDKHIDYNYLRIRMGDASLELGNYSQAIKHYNKAITFDEYGTYALSQKYYTLKLMGKNDRAYIMYKNFSPQLRKNLSPFPSFEFINFEIGHLFSPNISNDPEDCSTCPEDQLGVQYLVGDKQFYQAGFKFYLLKNLSLYAGYRNIKIETRKDIHYSEVTGVITKHNNMGYQRFPDTIPQYLSKSYNSEVDQNEIYLNAKLQFENGISVSGFANIILVSTELFKSNFQQNTVTDTAYYITGTGQYQLFDYTESTYDFEVTDTSFVNFVAGINIEKDLETFNLEAFLTISNFKGSFQTQLGVSSVYYPFGTSKFYGKTGLMYFAQRFNDIEQIANDNKLIFSQKLGYQIFKSTWFSVAGVFGNMTNANFENAFIVYNVTDKIRIKTDVELKMFLGRHIELNLNYQFFGNTRYFFIEDYDYENISYQSINYNTHSIIGGIKWNF